MERLDESGRVRVLYHHSASFLGGQVGVGELTWVTKTLPKSRAIATTPTSLPLPRPSSTATIQSPRSELEVDVLPAVPGREGGRLEVAVVGREKLLDMSSSEGVTGVVRCSRVFLVVAWLGRGSSSVEVMVEGRTARALRHHGLSSSRPSLSPLMVESNMS